MPPEEPLRVTFDVPQLSEELKYNARIIQTMTVTVPDGQKGREVPVSSVSDAEVRAVAEMLARLPEERRANAIHGALSHAFRAIRATQPVCRYAAAASESLQKISTEVLPMLKSGGSLQQHSPPAERSQN